MKSYPSLGSAVLLISLAASVAATVGLAAPHTPHDVDAAIEHESARVVAEAWLGAAKDIKNVNNPKKIGEHLVWKNFRGSKSILKLADSAGVLAAEYTFLNFVKGPRKDRLIKRLESTLQAKLKQDLHGTPDQQLAQLDKMKRKLAEIAKDAGHNVSQEVMKQAEHAALTAGQSILDESDHGTLPKGKDALLEQVKKFAHQQADQAADRTLAAAAK